MSSPRSACAPRLVGTTAADGYRLWARVWDGQPGPPARVVMLHGIISHGGWYLRTGRYLAESGMQVHLLDRRGSGLHLDRRGDVDHWQQWPADVERYIDALPPGPPVVLAGISWGAKLAVAIARRRRVPLAGLGLICPGLLAYQTPGRIKRTLLRALGRGRLGDARARIPLGDPGLFTDDPAWRDYIRTDPLTLRRVTLRFAREDLWLTRLATRTDPQLQLPTLLMLAGADRIVRREPTRQLVRAMTSGRAEILEYPGAAHTLEFDAAAPHYTSDLRDWLELVVTSAPQ